MVWDGNYDESDEDKGYKKYTRYNSPHKVSCYLVAGLPVIVWRKSAVASFVQKNNIGYVISNLDDINNIVLDDYKTKKANAMILGAKLKNGYYTQKSLEKALNKIDK